MQKSSMAVNLKIGTFNVRDLRDHCKRRKIFKYIQQHSFDIINLQESHSTVNDEMWWQAQWAGQAYFSNYSSKARGVITLIRKNAPVKVRKVEKDTQGRLLEIEIETESEKIMLINVYAPNEDSPNFFKALAQRIMEKDYDNLIMAGDFNLTIDEKLDRLNTNETNTKARNVLASMMKELRIIDVYREQHETEKKYTWRKVERGDKLKMARLDRILVSEVLVNRIKNTSIMTRYLSDHGIPWCMYLPTQIKRGPGFWRLNTSLLNDKEYCDGIREIIEEEKNEIYNNNLDRMEMMKLRFKEFSIKYSARKKRPRENMLKIFEMKLEGYEKMMHNTENSILSKRELKERIAQIEAERNKIIQYKIQGAKIRSGMKWIKEGEKNSKYFFSLQKYNFKRKNRFRLKLRDGSIITDPKKILQEQDKFYKKLYTSRNIEMDDLYLQNIIGQMPKISEKQKQELDEEISFHEFKNALYQFKDGKVPGNDGLPCEFYKKFFNGLKFILYDAIKMASMQGYKITTRRGILSLIEKAGKDLLLIDCWRPLNLLNLDYKLLGKILANRLYKVLPRIINFDQAGFMKKRSISDNLMDLMTVLEVCEKDEINSLLVSFDFYKAFDSVEYQPLYKAMRAFNIGEKYIQMARNYYKDIESCTTNQGWSQSYIKITQGLRQGCPYSAPAFNIIVEILAIKMRENDEIEGIQIAGRTKKLSQFADDLWTIIKATPQSFKEMTNTIQMFSEKT